MNKKALFLFGITFVLVVSIFLIGITKIFVQEMSKEQVTNSASILNSHSQLIVKTIKDDLLSNNFRDAENKLLALIDAKYICGYKISSNEKSENLREEICSKYPENIKTKIPIYYTVSESNKAWGEVEITYANNIDFSVFKIINSIKFQLFVFILILIAFFSAFYYLTLFSLHYSLNEIMQSKAGNNNYRGKSLFKFIWSPLILKFSVMNKKIDENKKLAAIGQTAAMLAHDVRKPFASVKALLANLNFFVKNPDKLDLAQKDLNKTISNVENMIADIMDFSREQKYELSRIDIKPIIENSVLDIKQNINEKFQINFKTEFNHKNFPLIEEHKIKRVFQNILSNAVEAITIMGNKTSGIVEIKTEEVIDKFIIRISNDGPLFEAGTEEAIFNSSFTSGKNLGTGLGLTSVKKIIELHEGTIVAQNLENKSGIEFCIFLKK